jgi:hypothetical protein
VKSCNKHGYLDTSPDARECPVCRVWGDKEAFDIPEPTAAELRHALRERVSTLEAENARLLREHEATIACLASCERERDALVRQIDAARFALTNCTCICKWVAEARAAVMEPEPAIDACAAADEMKG